MSGFHVERNGTTAVVTIDRPKANAIDAATSKAMGHAFAELDADPAVRAIVITGAGPKFFSAGWDLSAGEEFDSDYGVGGFGGFPELPHRATPVIAAVNGMAVGGGFEIAMAADLIVASESASFSDVYARWGLTPVWGLTLRLPHRIGTAKASEMLLTSRTYSGLEAQAMHLANFCFPDGQFETELTALCASIAANSWFANQVIKRALIETDGLTLRHAYALDLFKNEGLAPDAAKRVTKFLKRRDPKA